MPLPRQIRLPGQPSYSPQPPTIDYRALLGSPALGMYSEADIQRMADERAAGAIAPERAAIISAQQAAARRALGGEKATIGFTGAAQGLLGGIPGALRDAFGQARGEMTGLQGLSKEAAPFAQFAAGEIGGKDEAAQGYANLLPQIQGNLGQEHLASLISKSEGEQADYEQKLIDLAAKQPELRQQALDALYQHELDKLNMRLGIARDEREATNAERDYSLNVARLQQDIKESNRRFGLDTKSFEEGKRQFGLSFEEGKRQFNLQFEEGRSQFAKTYGLDEKKFEDDVRRYGLDHALAVAQQDLATETANRQYEIDTGRLANETAAQKLYEKQFGYKVTADQADRALEYAKLKATTDMEGAKLQFAKDSQAQDAAIAIAKIESQGGGINYGASRLRGVLVTNDGSVLKDSKGNPIKVDPRVYPSSSSSSKNVYPKALSKARTLRGNPITYDGPQDITVPGNSKTGKKPGFYSVKGKYLADPSAKGVFSVPNGQGGFIRTTNDPKKASYDSEYTFDQAIAYLQDQYPGLTRAQAIKALRVSGWRRASAASDSHWNTTPPPGMPPLRKPGGAQPR